jgi:hypothetical protein
MTTNEIILTILAVTSIVCLTVIVVCVLLIKYVEGLNKRDCDVIIEKSAEKIDRPKQNLGKCQMCNRGYDAVYTTYYNGNVCNKCSDFIGGLE